MKRRAFIAKASATSVLMGLGGLSLSGCDGRSRKHITILHTNDVHSHVDPFPIDHAVFPNMGGVSRRATLIAQIRQENPNTLLFDAGDIFQGTPYFNFYGGELEFKLMSMLRYDAATIGNHDFDHGIEALYAQLPNAKFELLSANYDFSRTVLDQHVKPYRTFLVDGIKIGVYGIGIELEGLVTQRLYQETKYLNPYEIANDCERHLKVGEKCDLVICLSHLGYQYKAAHKPNDLEMAAKTKYTDLVIGGHTHTFLDKPTVAKNIVGNDVLVNQVGAYGLNVGRIDFYFDERKPVGAKGVRIVV